MESSCQSSVCGLLGRLQDWYSYCSHLLGLLFDLIFLKHAFLEHHDFLDF